MSPVYRMRIDSNKKKIMEIQENRRSFVIDIYSFFFRIFIKIKRLYERFPLRSYSMTVLFNLHMCRISEPITKSKATWHDDNDDGPNPKNCLVAYFISKSHPLIFVFLPSSC